MFELLYSSVSLNVFSDSELADLLKQSRLKNKSLGITGMLIYHNNEFMQLLEGEESIVKELYKSIQKDERHRSVEVFYQGIIENRSFADWSMAFKLLDEESIERINEGYEEFSKDMNPIHLIKDSPNRGKKTFLSLKEML